jgi:SAM-dependent methyltransferase
MALNVDKLEVQKQWDRDPCGANCVTSESDDTLSYYRAVREHRYTQYAPWFDAVVRFAAVREKDVLEIGVGLGSDHARFASKGNRMTALDLSREHLRRTHRHLTLERLATKPVYGDGEEMPFADESFDVVYTFGVLHHTPNIETAVGEIHRVLRPGGKAIVGLYHRHSFFYWFATVCIEGILKAGFARKGYRRVMSEIEFRRDPGSAIPLVRVYSRAQVKRLFRDFTDVEVRTCHVESSHFWRLRSLLGALGRDRLERWFGWGGWYIVARAAK